MYTSLSLYTYTYIYTHIIQDIQMAPKVAWRATGMEDGYDGAVLEPFQFGEPLYYHIS